MTIATTYDKIQQHLQAAGELIAELATQGPWESYYTDDAADEISRLQELIGELAAIRTPGCSHPANRAGAATITVADGAAIATVYFDDGHTTDFVKRTVRDAYRELTTTYHLDADQVEELTELAEVIR